jgi:glutamine amidotransferase
MSSVAIVDYGMGNLHSIAKAVQKASPLSQVLLTDDPKTILSSDRVIFPGVGAARDCMRALNERDLPEVLAKVAKTRPLLGICLGMQVLLDRSEENGGTPCLGMLSGNVVRFSSDLRDPSGVPLKIPHMGWNRVNPVLKHPIWRDIPAGSWFYFVHSYFACPTNEEVLAATADYPHAFACALASENVVAVQFHPEKSQNMGLKLLENFMQWQPR